MTSYRFVTREEIDSSRQLLEFGCGLAGYVPEEFALRLLAERDAYREVAITEGVINFMDRKEVETIVDAEAALIADLPEVKTDPSLKPGEWRLEQKK